MNPTLVIRVVNGQVQLQGPLESPALCLELLAAGQRALAEILRQKEAQAAPRSQLFLPDGSPAPLSGERN